MYGAIVALLLMGLFPAQGSDDPVTLASELGSARYSQRQKAEQALAGLGRAALPALRLAETSPDPEVRTRASVIRRRIEGNLLVEPTMVSLHYDQVPLEAAIAAINQEAGLKLKLMPDLPPLWAGRRISVQRSKPVPFWKALDLVCEAGSLHHAFGGQNDFEQGDPSIAIYDGFAAHQGMFHDQGPFRIQLASLNYQSEIHLSTEHGSVQAGVLGVSPPGTPARMIPATSRQFFLQMLVGAEPRLSLTPAGAVKLTEAVDDQGQSLLLPTQTETVQHVSGFLGVNSSPLVHLRVDLAHPDRAMARLKRIKGLIPLNVSSRQGEPLEISLDASTSRTQESGGVSITLTEVRLNSPDQAPTIDLTLKASSVVPGLAAESDDDAIRQIASPQQLEVLDDTGRPIPWFPSSSLFNGEEAKLTLTLLDRGGPARATRIRYHAVICDRIDVSFEFRDLPIP